MVRLCLSCATLLLALAAPAGAAGVSLSGDQLALAGTAGDDTLSVSREQGAVVFSAGDPITVDATADPRCDDGGGTSVRCDATGLATLAVAGGAGRDLVTVSRAGSPRAIVDCGEGTDRIDAPLSDDRLNCEEDPVGRERDAEEWRQIAAARDELDPDDEREERRARDRRPRMPGRATARWSVGRRTTVVRALALRGLPRSAYVTLRLDGESWEDLRPRRRRVNLARHIAGITLRPGDVVAVDITAVGYRPRTIRWKIRRGAKPRVTTG